MIRWELDEAQASDLAAILDQGTQGVNNARITVPLYDSLMKAVSKSKPEGDDEDEPTNPDPA